MVPAEIGKHINSPTRPPRPRNSSNFKIKIMELHLVNTKIILSTLKGREEQGEGHITATAHPPRTLLLRAHLKAPWNRTIITPTKRSNVNTIHLHSTAGQVKLISGSVARGRRWKKIERKKEVIPRTGGIAPATPHVWRQPANLNWFPFS